MIDLKKLKEACSELEKSNPSIKAFLLGGSAGMHSSKPDDYDLWVIYDENLAKGSSDETLNFSTQTINIEGPGLDKEMTINRMIGLQEFRSRCARPTPPGNMWDLPFLFERRLIELPFEVLYVADDFGEELRKGVELASNSTIQDIVYGFLGKDLEEKYKTSGLTFQNVREELHKYYLARLQPSPKHYGKDKELTEFVDSVLWEREKQWVENLYKGLVEGDHWWRLYF